MRRWLVVLVVLTVACTQGGQSAVKSPSPTLVSSPAASPSPVTGDLPLSRVSFSCRLPIYKQQGYEGSPDFSRQGAFLTFPAASMAIDNNGTGGAYFDRAFKRWLPVTRESVSPDGAHYAYANPADNMLHVVDVVGGNERTFSLSAIGANDVFDYGADGIYMTLGFEGLHGLWLVNPATGSVRETAYATPPPSGATGFNPQASAGGGIFWIGEVNPADPNPQKSPVSLGPDQIVRLDFASGHRIIWLYREGISLFVIGLDAGGQPLIVSSDGTEARTELLIALDQGSQRSIFKGALLMTLNGAIADSHGVWFGSPQGIYLYSDANGLQKVSNQPGYPANGCF
jgi:hypothetical protein